MSAITSHCFFVLLIMTNFSQVSYCLIVFFNNHFFNQWLISYNFCLIFETGWSHFAQFTIAVVNKDPKKSKYSGWLVRWWFSCNVVFEFAMFCLNTETAKICRYIASVLEERA